MICRIWRGWTTPQQAREYENLLVSTIIPGIEARCIAGFRHIDMMRRQARNKMEFTTIMWFDDLASIEAFVGEDPEVAHVPAIARAVLSRFDERALHYEVFDRRSRKQPHEKQQGQVRDRSGRGGGQPRRRA
jgi:antibiotic biosynthesis monooxygenase (ABM) superfamily enzyme